MPINLPRYVISFMGAFIVVFSLFYLMQFLIKNAQTGLNEDDASSLLEFVRLDRDESVARKKPKPKKPPPPEQAPDQPPPPQMDDVNPEANAIAIQAVSVDTNISLSADGFGLSASDGEYLPIVKVQPIYPRRALSRGIEGYVIVQFTVTRTGTTRDHIITEAKPTGMFDRAAIQAATKFKYKPRVVDGEAIEVPGVQNKITFEIED
jgi:protein TonB